MKKIIALSVIALALLCVNSFAYDGGKEAKVKQAIFFNDFKLKQALANDPPHLALILRHSAWKQGMPWVLFMGTLYGDPKLFAQKLGIEPHHEFLKYGYDGPLYGWLNLMFRGGFNG